jgi:hypothetical protein
MRTSLASLVVFACAWMSPLAGSARATSIVPMTVEQIASASDVIVDGELIEVHSRFVGKRILTFATLRVDRVLKGEVVAAPAGASRTVTFAALGGVVGSVGQKVPGSPIPVLHARYLLALSKAEGPESARHIIGFSQGMWRVDGEGTVLVVDPKAPVQPPRVTVSALEARLSAPAAASPAGVTAP